MKNAFRGALPCVIASTEITLICCASGYIRHFCYVDHPLNYPPESYSSLEYCELQDSEFLYIRSVYSHLHAVFIYC